MGRAMRVTAPSQVGMAKSIWHNNRGQRGWNLMWGDGHVSLFRFPKNYGPAQMDMPVNITSAWW